jgi:peptidoglycan/xylan/chitin deacetylase (PgdA/CDA1 family)
MTVTTEHFKQQLDLLTENHYTVIPLSQLVAWKLGQAAAPPPRSIVLTFADGLASVYTDARPILLQKNIPATLFIYPSGISSGPAAMTWQELSAMAATSLFSVGSHTYRHPNFRREMRRQPPDKYEAFVDAQLTGSRTVLQEKLNRPVDILAWPFGIYTPSVVQRAGADGYVAAFAVDCRAVTRSDNMMELPRCVVTDQDVGPRFLALLDRCYRFAGKPGSLSGRHLIARNGKSARSAAVRR